MGNGQSNNKGKRKYSEFYKTADNIGQGTFAMVKRCTRKKDKKEFAVKIVDKRTLTSNQLTSLKDEIRIIKSIQKSVHIISLMDVYDEGHRVKIILELCEGGNLYHKIQNSPNKHLDERNSAQITFVLANTLKYLHDHYVVHRDMKPENILFTKNGTLKISDFGIAHYVQAPPSLHIMDTCCGTPHYVAPEVLSEKTYSYQVDLWSLGVILYNMLSGKQPFNSHSVSALYEIIVRGEYEFASPYWDKISNEAKNLVKNLMCINYKKRYTEDQVIKHPFIRKHV